MLGSSVTDVSGWVAIALVVLTVPLPFLLRRVARQAQRDPGGTRPQLYLRRLRPHYWLGYLIAALSLAHAWIPMSVGLAARDNQTGLYVATAALLLIAWQVMVGRRLSDRATTGRRNLRRMHLWVMAGIVTLGIVHLALNGPLAITALAPSH